jgi:hypothetical protein
MGDHREKHKGTEREVEVTDKDGKIKLHISINVYNDLKNSNENTNENNSKVSSSVTSEVNNRHGDGDVEHQHEKVTKNVEDHKKDRVVDKVRKHDTSRLTDIFNMKSKNRKRR